MEDFEAYPSIGIAVLDDEHRALGNALRLLLEAVKDDDWPRCVVLAEVLIDGAAAHFLHEEQLMESIGFTFFGRHKRTHDAFLQEARHHIEELRAHGLTAACLRWTAETMEWFRAHVLTEDMALGRALAAAGVRAH